MERQPESLIIGKRKPSLEFQFQNKFRLGGEILPRARSGNVIVRGKMIGGGDIADWEEIQVDRVGLQLVAMDKNELCLVGKKRNLIAEK